MQALTTTLTLLKNVINASSKDEVVKIAKEAKSFGLGQSILEAYTEKIKEFEG